MLFSNRMKGNFPQFGLLCCREPRNMCPILKGWFASDFESEGRVLPAALHPGRPYCNDLASNERLFVGLLPLS